MVRLTWDFIRANAPLYFLLTLYMVILLGSFSVVSLVSIWFIPTDLGIPLIPSTVLAVVLIALSVANEVWVKYRRREYLSLAVGMFVFALAVAELLSFARFLPDFLESPIAPANLTGISLYLKIAASMGPALAILVVLDGVLWLFEKSKMYFKYRRIGP
jgi:hypothetical protein